MSNLSDRNLAALKQMATEFRLEDNNIFWKSRQRQRTPTPTEILAKYAEFGGDVGDITPNALIEELRGELNRNRHTVEIVRRYRKLSSYDIDILKGVRWSGIEGVVKLYLVANASTRTVVPVEDPSKIHQALSSYHLLDKFERNYERVVDRAISNGEIADVGGVVHDSRADKLVIPTFEDYIGSVIDLVHTAKTLRIPEPKRLANDPTVVNFTYFDLDGIKEGPCPDWTDWELSMPEYCRPVWRAWFYSIFVAENEGRQLCWLKGQGFDGKSQVGKAIRRILGPQSTASINKTAMSNQFGFSGLYGKRFILYGDCRNSLATHSEKIHQITGGDIVSIEFKGQTPFAGHIYGKLLICANTDPSIHYHERNERTRIIYIPLHDPPEHIRKKYNLVGKDGKLVKRNGEEVGTGYRLADRLVEQGYAYLALCKPHYEKLCPNDSELILPTQMMKMIESSCVSDEVVDYTKFASRELTIDPEAYADSRELRDAYADYLERKVDSYEYSGLIRYLKNKFNCEKERRRAGDSRAYVVTGIRLKKSVFGAKDDTSTKI